MSSEHADIVQKRRMQTSCWRRRALSAFLWASDMLEYFSWAWRQPAQRPCGAQRPREFCVGVAEFIRHLLVDVLHLQWHHSSKDGYATTNNMMKT